MSCSINTLGEKKVLKIGRITGQYHQDLQHMNTIDVYPYRGVWSIMLKHRTRFTKSKKMLKGYFYSAITESTIL